MFAQFFNELLGERKVVDRDIRGRIFAACLLLTEDFSGDIREFSSLVITLGQYVAGGDEKRFHFSGNAGNVRLVNSKPDRIGLWLYELWGRLESGLLYMLNVLIMHYSLRSVRVL